MIWLIALLLAAPASAWQHDWKTAFRTAKEQHRLVFVTYTQTEARCKPCWQFKESLRSADVQQRLRLQMPAHARAARARLPR
jgi:hypothetical protein